MSDNIREIEINLIHVCNDGCKFAYDTIENETKEEGVIRSFTVVRKENPSYIDGKCNRFGKPDENISWINISRFLEDENHYKFVDEEEIVISNKKVTIEYTYPLGGEFIFEYQSDNGFTIRDIVRNICQQYQYIYQVEEETASLIDYTFQKKCTIKNFIIKDYKSFDASPLRGTICKEETIETMEIYFPDSYQDSCPICLDCYKKDEAISMLPCKHTYHIQCIKKWFETNKTCPLCKEKSSKKIICGKCNEGTIDIQYNTKVIPKELREQLLNRHETDGIYGIWGHDIEDLAIEGITYHKGGLIFLSIGS